RTRKAVVGSPRTEGAQEDLRPNAYQGRSRARRQCNECQLLHRQLLRQAKTGNETESQHGKPTSTDLRIDRPRDTREAPGKSQQEYQGQRASDTERDARATR